MDPPAYITVDHGERPSGIGNLLRDRFQIPVRFLRLAIGDYLIECGRERVFVERKTRADFAISLIDGRLFRQAARLSSVNGVGLFLVEGEERAPPVDTPKAPPTNSNERPEFENRPDGHSNDRSGSNGRAGSAVVHPHSLLGAEVSLVCRWRIPILYARDREMTARILALIAEQSDFRERRLIRREGRAPRDPWRRRRYLIEALPGIGPRLAVRLLDRFGSIEAVMNAHEEEIRSVEGIGKAKAKSIRRFIGNASAVTKQPAD